MSGDTLREQVAERLGELWELRDLPRPNFLDEASRIIDLCNESGLRESDSMLLEEERYRVREIGASRAGLLIVLNELRLIPKRSDLHASRYDTDDEAKIHLWSNEGESWDIAVPLEEHLDGAADYLTDLAKVEERLEEAENRIAFLTGRLKPEYREAIKDILADWAENISADEAIDRIAALRSPPAPQRVGCPYYCEGAHVEGEECQCPCHKPGFDWEKAWNEATSFSPAPQAEESGWIGVKERLPGENTECQVAGLWKGKGWQDVALFSGGEWYLWDCAADSYDFLAGNVTHWMPLPPPPKGASDDPQG